MSAAIIIALIALAASLLTALVTVFGTSALQARKESTKVLDAYREPVLAAAYELQARLHNILCVGFVERYIVGNEADKRQSAINTTLYVFAQYFGWREIIRQEVQYLRFSRDKRTREISSVFRDITETFLSNAYGQQIMIWRVEQRAIGERMIELSNSGMTSSGYGSFLEKRNTMSEWLDRIASDLEALDDGGRQRLTKLQHLLLGLVQTLDDKGTRYPFDMEAA